MPARRHTRQCPNPRSRRPCHLDRLFGIWSPRHLLTRVVGRLRLYHRHRHGDGLLRCRSPRLCFPDDLGSQSRLEHPTDEEQVSRRPSMSFRQCEPSLRTLAARQGLYPRLRSVLSNKSRLRTPPRNLSHSLCPVLLRRTRTSSLRLIRSVAPPHLALRLPLRRRQNHLRRPRSEKRRDGRPSRFGVLIRPLRLVRVPPRVGEVRTRRSSRGSAMGSRRCRNGVLVRSRWSGGRSRLRGSSWRVRMGQRARDRKDRCIASSMRNWRWSTRGALSPSRLERGRLESGGSHSPVSFQSCLKATLSRSR